MPDPKLVYTVDENDAVVYVRTIGSAVKNNAGQDLGGVEAGAQVNLVETMEIVYGADTTAIPIASKKASIDLSAFAKTVDVDAKLSSTYKAAGSAANVAGLGTLDAAHEGFVYNVTAEFTTTADFVEGAGKIHPAGTNVVIANVGTTASPSYKYDVLAGFVDLSTYDAHLANTDIHVTAAQKTEWSGKQDAITSSAKLNADLVDDSTATNKFVTTTEKTTWSGKQDAITNANKLSADLLADGTTNAVVTQTEKAAFAAKQNAITSSAKLASDLVDDTNQTNKFVTAAEKTTWSGKQDEITSSNKLSSDLVDDTNATNKFVTAAQASAINSALQPGDVQQTYIGSGTGSDAPISGAGVKNALDNVVLTGYLRYREVID